MLFCHKRGHRVFLRGVVFCVLVAFGTLTILPSHVCAQFQGLPAPGTMVQASPSFTPPIIRGMTIHPKNPFQFDFIIDAGDDHLKGEAFKKESEKLIKYFLAALTVPEDEMWVNLSPHEPDRIIPEQFGQTEMGRDLLAQDYILKQLTASLMHPEENIGKKFWNEIKEKTTEDFETFNKVWIVPNKASVYVHNTNVFVVDADLKVMLEEDYAAMARGDLALKNNSNEVKDIFKRTVLSEIEREVNEGASFAKLRQIYHSTILANWYKQNLKESILTKIYVDQNKISGVNHNDQDAAQKIYNQYLEAFKKGVYSFIKEEPDPVTSQPIPKKYFSGGAALAHHVDHAMMPNKELERTLEQNGLAMVSVSMQSDAAMAGKRQNGKQPGESTHDFLVRVLPNHDDLSSTLFDLRAWILSTYEVSVGQTSIAEALQSLGYPERSLGRRVGSPDQGTKTFWDAIAGDDTILDLPNRDIKERFPGISRSTIQRARKRAEKIKTRERTDPEKIRTLEKHVRLYSDKFIHQSGDHIGKGKPVKQIAKVYEVTFTIVQRVFRENEIEIVRQRGGANFGDKAEDRREKELEVFRDLIRQDEENRDHFDWYRKEAAQADDRDAALLNPGNLLPSILAIAGDGNSPDRRSGAPRTKEREQLDALLDENPHRFDDLTLKESVQQLAKEHGIQGVSPHMLSRALREHGMHREGNVGGFLAAVRKNLSILDKPNAELRSEFGISDGTIRNVRKQRREGTLFRVRESEGEEADSVSDEQKVHRSAADPQTAAGKKPLRKLRRIVRETKKDFLDRLVAVNLDLLKSIPVRRRPQAIREALPRSLRISDTWIFNALEREKSLSSADERRRKKEKIDFFVEYARRHRKVLIQKSVGGKSIGLPVSVVVAVFEITKTPVNRVYEELNIAVPPRGGANFGGYSKTAKGKAVEKNEQYRERLKEEIRKDRRINQEDKRLLSWYRKEAEAKAVEIEEGLIDIFLPEEDEDGDELVAADVDLDAWVADEVRGFLRRQETQRIEDEEFFKERGGRAKGDAKAWEIARKNPRILGLRDRHARKVLGVNQVVLRKMRKKFGIQKWGVSRILGVLRDHVEKNRNFFVQSSGEGVPIRVVGEVYEITELAGRRRPIQGIYSKSSPPITIPSRFEDRSSQVERLKDLIREDTENRHLFEWWRDENSEEFALKDGGEETKDPAQLSSEQSDAAMAEDSSSKVPMARVLDRIFQELMANDRDGVTSNGVIVEMVFQELGKRPSRSTVRKARVRNVATRVQPQSEHDRFLAKIAGKVFGVLQENGRYPYRGDEDEEKFEKGDDEALLGQNPGGIDLGAGNGEIEEQGGKIEFNFPAHDSTSIIDHTFEGLYPVIVNVVPVTNVRMLLGLDSQGESRPQKPLTLGPNPDPIDRPKASKIEIKKMSKTPA